MSGGYGKLKSDDGLIGAHRASWILANGPIPDGLCVLHRCDNPPCVNPAHLWVGTHADNAADKVAKGRARGGPPLLTHCRRGHEYTPENTSWFKQATGQPGRRCRICTNERQRVRKRRH